jgi:hypothetical protein
MLWSEEVKNNKGLPRPYVYSFPKFQTWNNKKFLDKKVPIPFQSKPAMNEGGLVLNIENEKIVVDNGLCSYCGLGIDDNEISFRWMVEKQDFESNMQRDWVPSDFYPLHKKCMKQARYFCPFMRNLKDEDFDIRLNKDNLKIAKDLIKKYFVIEWEKRERRK